MRRAVAIGVAVVVAGAPIRAFGDGVAWQSGVGEIGVSDHQPGEPGDSGGGAAAAASGPGQQLYTYWAIGWAGDRFCRVRHVTTDPDLAAAYNFALHHDLAAANATGGAAECPAGTPTIAPAAPTPDQVARDFWDVRLLPSPSLHMQPGYAVTGKRVYLEIDSEATKHFDVPDALGPPVSIEATSTYVIDWGDGVIESTTSRGGPWPHGDVTHVYTTSAAARTVTVTQQWSATWRAGGQQGALDNLRTGGSLTFRVTQVQAVRE
jgi:hypothetical protein